MNKELLNEILQLPVDRRLELVQKVWDSIAASPEMVPTSDWHRDELDRRLEQPSEEADLSWDEVRTRLDNSGDED